MPEHVSKMPQSKWWWISGSAVLIAGVFVFIVLGMWSRPRHVAGSDILRSGQLSSKDLAQVIIRRGLGTVVNLRGHGGGKAWYPAELSVCNELGVAHHTVSFNVDDWVPRARIVRLVELLEHAKRPILFHCRRGADRTGLAAAVAILFDGRPVREAAAQLTLAGGHICRRNRCPQHLFLEAYRRHVENEVRTSSSAIFTQWVNERYCPSPYDASLSLVSPLPDHMRTGETVEWTVQAANRGGSPWVMTAGAKGVRLGARVFGPFAAFPDDPVKISRNARIQGRDLGRSGLEDAAINPGDSRLFKIATRLPESPGLYLLQIDMVQEHVHWFSEMGWPGIILKVRVEGIPTDQVFSDRSGANLKRKGTKETTEGQ